MNRSTTKTRRHQGQALVFGPASQLANLAVVLLVATPLVLTIPEWLRATVIGCSWGALTLAGLTASWSGRRLVSGLYALGLAQLAQQSMQISADLDHNAAWTLVIVVLGSGWSVGLLWTPWRAEHREPGCITTGVEYHRGLTRWSIWDMACLSTGVAVLSWAVPRNEMPLHLICQIAPALVGGWLISFLAIEWACRDHWSPTRLLLVIVGAPVACGGCLWIATTTSGLQTLGWWAVLCWWLAGPGSVITAQGVTVLAYLGAVRLDTQLANQLATRDHALPAEHRIFTAEIAEISQAESPRIRVPESLGVCEFLA